MKSISYYLKNISTFYFILISLVALFCLSIWLSCNSDFLEIDDCLDSGGRFNYEIKECEYR